MSTSSSDGLHVWTDEQYVGQAKAAGVLRRHRWTADERIARLVRHPAAARSADRVRCRQHHGQRQRLQHPGRRADLRGDWWLTSGSSADAKDVDPSGANNGGNGSAWFGTLAEWAAALPDARFYAGGFSLGSGVKGDGFLESITYGDTTYTFTSAAAPAVVDVTGKTLKKVGHFKARLDFISNAQPADSVQGKKLKWRVTVDGKRTFVTKQGFGDHDTLIERFAKNSGKHRIEVFKNGVKVRHFAVRTHV